jgi:hypothetical protein
VSDYEFSRAFGAAYRRMPLWRRDQFDASVRELAVALTAFSDAIDRAGEERGGG